MEWTSVPAGRGFYLRRRSDEHDEIVEADNSRYFYVAGCEVPMEVEAGDQFLGPIELSALEGWLRGGA